MKIYPKILLLSLLCSCVFAQPHVLDKENTIISFSVSKHLFLRVEGVFEDYSAMIDFNKDTAIFNALKADIKTISLRTDDAKRDTNLRGEDFFMVSKYPDMTFVMTEYKKIDSQRGKMHGILTIAKISKQIVLDVFIKDDAKNTLFTLDGKISRKDFDFAPNYSAITIGNEIKIHINATMSLKNQAKDLI